MISKLVTQNIDVGFIYKLETNKETKQSQINPLCSTQLSLFQRNNMVNLCICSMQVHQSKFSLSFLLPHLWKQKSSTVVASSFSQVYVPLFMLLTAPLRSRSLPRCCSWPPFSEPGRGTCTCPRQGTGTCTRWPRREGCCGDTTAEINDRRASCALWGEF